MLSEAKHLAFSSCHEDEILRLRLRMTLHHSVSSLQAQYSLGVAVKYILH
jgi:hypothetical protein